MDPRGIRIKLNLAEFFSDKRKYSYMFIEENKIKDFYDLKSRIRDEFDIRGNFIFLIDNVFVPYSQSIKLLHEEETLTLSADAEGLSDLQTRSLQNSQTNFARERKRKKKVGQPEDEREESTQYFETEDDTVLVTQKKRKKVPALEKGHDFQNMSHSYSDICAIKQETVTDETIQSENEVFLKVNEIYSLRENNNEKTPTFTKKKRDKKAKNGPIISEEQLINNECETISSKDYSQINSNVADEKIYFQDLVHIKEEQKKSRKLSDGFKENSIKKGKKNTKTDTPIGKSEGNHSKEEMSFDDTKEDGNELIVQLNNETDLNESREGIKMEVLSEKCEYIKIKQTSTSDKSTNHVENIHLINEEPKPTDAGNIENCSLDRKRKRVRTRRRKRNDQLSASESTDQCKELNLGSIPGASHIRFSDEISEEYVTDTASEIISVKGNLNKINISGKERCVYMNSVDNGLKETIHSAHLNADTSQIPTNSAVCLSRMTTPTPVDTFHKLLSLRKHSSTPCVFNRALSNSNTFQKITTENKHEEKHVVINSENVDCITVENYPLINSFPKEGDILAFKLYRMASDYTPYISDYIIVTVLQYFVDTCQITVKVLRGLDQLQEPQGRFSLLEDNEESCDQNDTYEFNWNELMETRLLFP